MSELKTFVDLEPTTVTIYSVIYYAITVINLIVTPTYMYVVIFKSKDSMRSYKNLLIAGMPFLIYSMFSVTFTIPIYAYETCVYQFHGLINRVPRDVNIAMTTSVILCDQTNGDLLLVMLINRYQSISSDFVERSRYLYPGIYAFIAVTNVIQICLVFMKVFFPPLEDSIISATLLMVVTGLILISRIYAHIRIVYLNKKFAIQIKPTISPATFELHTMLFRAVLSNVILTMVVKLSFLTLIIGILIDQTVMEVMINVITIIRNLGYIGEMIITLYFVKPYRLFIVNIFCKRAEEPHVVMRSDT